MKMFSKDFYERNPASVAKDLLGKTLLRKLESEVLSGKIVETEAYYGGSDPASRAYRGRKRFNELMFMSVGKAFIYMVHANWLLNIVAHVEGGVGAVLIRAIEPIEGIENMQEHHPDVPIFLAAIDDHLNERGYIVPGLGDAGDRQFGTA